MAKKTEKMHYPHRVHAGHVPGSRVVRVQECAGSGEAVLHIRGGTTGCVHLGRLAGVLKKVSSTVVAKATKMCIKVNVFKVRRMFLMCEV